MQLVIAEKPSVARSIAEVLGATDKKNGYLEGNGYIVSWCVGHLVELAQPDAYGERYGKWSYDSLPILPTTWKYMVKEDTKAQYQVLYQLMKDDRVDTVICATDAGREGELIFRLTYKMAECKKAIKRLWISSMEERAIKDGFDHLRPGSDYDHLYMAALGRQQADWLVGLNGTRLFTVLYGGKTLKVGRVQTPTLAMLVDRETMILNFVKEKYYTIHLDMNGLDVATKRIDDKALAEAIMQNCQNKQARISKVIKEETIDVFLKQIRINNTLAGANKESKKLLADKYNVVGDYISNKEYNSICNLMCKATPEVVSDKNILFTFKNGFEVVLFDKNVEQIQKLLKEIYKKKFDIVAIDLVQWNKIKEKYIKDTNEGIKYTYVKEEIKDKKNKNATALEKEVENIFGDDLITVE